MQRPDGVGALSAGGKGLAVAGLAMAKTIEEDMKICLVASAARKELLEWCGFAGEWMTELAFGELEENEGELLHSHLSALLHSVPELWVSCGKADAALQAWCFR